LPNIIKASQYDGMESKDTYTSNFDHPIQLFSDEMTKSEVRDRHQAIVKDAFQKAKDIVEAAENYSLNQLKESTMRMNEECAQMKMRSYEDGYSQGLVEGKKEGNMLGYQSGFEAGLKKAEEETRETRTQARDELCLILEAVEKKKTEILNQFEADLEQLAITIAQKVIQ